MNTETTTINHPKLKNQRYPFKFDWLTFIKNNPISPTAIVMGGIGSLFLSLTVSLFFVTPLVVSLLAGIFYFHGVNRHHYKGYLMPAQVISTSPCRIAVYTDLATNKSAIPYPALKLMSLPNPNNALKLNDKTPMLGVYQGDISELRWDDFSPKLIRSSTNDTNVIDGATQTIPTEAWQALEQSLATLTTPQTNGLYLLFEHDENKEHEYYGVTSEKE